VNQGLVDRLARLGKPTETWTSPDGSRILVLAYGGRILGLFSQESAENFFWTHPALESVETARALYRSPEWHNSGGDRTWLSPEIDFFFPDFPNLNTYRPPLAMDPGDYQLAKEEGSLTLTNRFTYRLSRSQSSIKLEVSKRLAAAPNPLRHADGAGRLDYAGYTLRARLTVASSDSEAARVALWSLLQLPHGGELLIATFSKASYTTYFGQVDSRDLSISEHLVRYRMRADGEHKLGFKAHPLTGRVAYLYSLGDESRCLVVRNFFVNPSGAYLDVPSTEINSIGSAVEACNIRSNLGEFSELEYHTPAIVAQEGAITCEDESQLWAFRGKERDILEAARILVSSEV
jgi:hypothetical protein